MLVKAICLSIIVYAYASECDQNESHKTVLSCLSVEEKVAYEKLDDIQKQEFLMHLVTLGKLQPESVQVQQQDKK